MKKLKTRFVSVILFLAVGLLFGFNFNSNGFTDFYYYQGKPFKLNFKPDAVFIELQDNVTASTFAGLISAFPEIKSNSDFNVQDKKDFVLLNKSITADKLSIFLERLNQRTEVKYASIAFSPDEGKTLIGVQNEILVQFKPGLTEREISDYLSANKLQVIEELKLQGGISYKLQTSGSDFPLDAANSVYESGLVNWAEPNLFFTNVACYMPNDPFVTQQWSVKNTGNNIPGGVTGTPGCDMSVENAWDISLGDPSVIVSVSDTGCDTLHADLAANFIPGTGFNFFNNTPGGFDDEGHGTGCAGIIAAIGNNSIGISGIAPLSKLLPVKWLSSQQSGDYAGASNATIYSYQKGAWIISNSWGFYGGASSALDQAIADAKNLGRGGKGTLFVVAAGNENGAMRFPANTNPNVLVVGGLSPCNQRKSPSSCDGEAWGASYGSNLDIVAPCVKIYTTDITGGGGYSSGDYYSVFNGTSSATPNTAGVCALLLAVDPSLTWDSVRVRIDRTADKVGSYNYNGLGPRNIGQWNVEMGHGRVNAHKVLLETLNIMGPLITHTPLGNTEQITGNYTVNCSIVSVNSSLDPTGLKIFWSKDNLAITDSALLTHVSGDNFTGDIIGTGAGIYRYYIQAKDVLARVTTDPFGAPTNLHSFEAATDLVPPTITHTQINDTPQLRWPVNVTANVTDNIGVQSVECEFRVNGGAITKFPMPLVSGDTYKGTFTESVLIGDVIEYRVKATDNSSQNNVGYLPATGYYSFNIIDALGLVLVINDDVSYTERNSSEKGAGSPDLLTPLGASADLFKTTLTNVGYLVDQVTWSAFNTSALTDYDLVILSAGLNTGVMFNDQAKRTAITNWTIAGGKTIVEGGEIGWQYRQTSERDVQFRRNVLNDSSWVSDRANAPLEVATPTHPIFTTPNSISDLIFVDDATGSGYGTRDEVTVLNKTGVSRIAYWYTGTASNAGIIVYNPNNDPEVCRNVFYTFSISQFADQTIAAKLIENTVNYLLRDIVPVELTSFSAAVVGNSVNLNWTTATETNNQGFEVQRSNGGEFRTIGFVDGHGTTTEPKAYSFTDSKLANGEYTYRLKQVDFDGTFTYSTEVSVEVELPLEYSLEQNYPNPFNPSTTIKFSIAKDGFVKLVIYNMLGEEVTALVNGVQKAGRYEVTFDGSKLASGVYVYRLEAPNFISSKKLILLR